MSWFSLSERGKEVFSTYSTISGLCTGNTVGTYLFNKFVQPSYLQTRLRNATAGVASRLMASKVDQLSVQASDRFLQISLTKGKWKHLRGKLKESFLQDPKEYLLLIGKIGTHLFKQKVQSYVKKTGRCGTAEPPSSDQQMEEDVVSNTEVSKEKIRFFPGTYAPEQAKQIKSLIKQGNFKEAIYQAIFSNLKPTCDHAIQKSLNTMVKNAAGGGCDFVVQKGLMVACLPTIYAATLFTLQWAAKQCGDETYTRLTQTVEAIPTPYTMLAISTLANAAEMTHIVWQTVKQASRGDSYDKDKEDVKQMILKHVKDSASKTLMDNQFLSEIGLTKDPEKAKGLVETLVSETVDLYWDDLHQKKILGLPLVT